MTLLKKWLSDTVELSPKDTLFEKFLVETVADPKLTSLQKRMVLKGMTEIAETDFQKSAAENYYGAADALTNGDNGARVDPQTLEKAKVMLLCIEVLLKTAERKRKQK